MISTLRRQTLFILGLALSLSVTLIVIATDGELRERLGDTYWVLGLAIIGAILLVLAGYVFDRNLIAKLKEINHHASGSRDHSDRAVSNIEDNADDPDEIMGLARKIEQMARSLQKTEASYRAIVEDQADLICRYKSDGRLTFVNGAYAQFLGRKRTELTGAVWSVLAEGLTPWRVPDPWPETSSFETVLLDSNGKRHVFQWSHRAIKDRDDQPIEYQSVGHDVSVHKQAELALRNAKEAAESADRAKSEFIAVVSHEIRTPVNGVLGFIRLLRDTPLTDEQVGYAETIQRCGESLETLVSDILDLSKIEAGRLGITIAPFALRECVDEINRLFAATARQAGLALQIEIAPGVPPILEGDQNRLRQILSNLVGNALKFTEKGGVTVRIAGDFVPGEPTSGNGVRGYTLRAEIIDTGIGIAASDYPKLFKAFSQLDTTSTRRRGGTGLGLAISKKLCELMGGGIALESKPGHGSTFRFHVQFFTAKGDTVPPFPIPGASRSGP
ncbi:MAG: ATP-binding protein [Verrucomicrobia bacterium]|nr:ATP-binding protein [Verrucomicrobiota bacterium]